MCKAHKSHPATRFQIHPLEEKSKLNWRLRKRLKHGYLRNSPGGGAYRAFISAKTKGQRGKVTSLQLRRSAREYRELPEQEKAEFQATGKDMALAHKYSKRKPRESRAAQIDTLALRNTGEAPLSIAASIAKAECTLSSAAVAKHEKDCDAKLHEWVAQKRDEYGQIFADCFPSG
jgi:hypothetical protein